MAGGVEAVHDIPELDAGGIVVRPVVGQRGMVVAADLEGLLEIGVFAAERVGGGFVGEL